VGVYYFAARNAIRRHEQNKFGHSREESLIQDPGKGGCTEKFRRADGINRFLTYFFKDKKIKKLEEK